MQHQILELFPTPVYTTRLPDHLASISTFLFSQEMLGMEAVDEVNYGARSKNSYILHEPETKDLGNFIMDQVNIFANDHLFLNYNGYKFSQSWLSLKKPGQHHTQHTHPNSIISGVFFFGEPAENTPALTFHRTGGVIGQNSIMLKYKENLDNAKYAWERFQIKFEPGLLLLFPSHFHHSVPINETNKTRYSLAFNVVPIEGLGDERSLTELKF